METASEIGSLLKRLYRNYSHEVLSFLEGKGFNDLRASFLEILVVVSENDGPTLKFVGDSCGLKKQTMTSHVNELVKRGYLKKVQGKEDKREQRIYFTELGEKFRMSLKEAISKVHDRYIGIAGEIEVLKLHSTLSDFFKKIEANQE